MEETAVNNGSLPEDKKPSKLKQAYVWIITSAGFLSQLAANFTVAGWGMCLAYMAADFGVETTTLAIGTSIFGVIYAALAVFWGNMSDRIGIRKVMSIGTLCTGVFMLSIGLFAHDAITAIVLYAITGVFLSAISFALLPKLCGTWFATHSRGIGFGIVAAGGSTGGIILGIIAPMMIKFGGWEAYFIIVGIIVLVIGLFIAIFVRDSPASMGLLPYGAEKETEEIINQKVVDKNAREESNFERIKRILKLPNMWKMAIVFILFQIYYMSHQALFISALLQAGYDITVSGLISSITYVGITVGQVVFPIVSDRFARKNVLGILLTLAGIMYIILSFVLKAALPVTVVLVIVAIAGVLFAANAMMQATMTELFPPDLRGAGPGVINTLGMIGKFAGPVVAGSFVVATGGSLLNYPLFAGPCALLAGLIALFTLPKTSGKYGDPIAEKYAKEHNAGIDVAKEEATA